MAKNTADVAAAKAKKQKTRGRNWCAACSNTSK